MDSKVKIVMKILHRERINAEQNVKAHTLIQADEHAVRQAQEKYEAIQHVMKLLENQHVS